MSVLAGGKLLIGSANLLQDGFTKISFTPVTAAAAGIAVQQNNWVHTTRLAAGGASQLRDVEHAYQTYGCATTVSVPIQVPEPVATPGSPTSIMRNSMFSELSDSQSISSGDSMAAAAEPAGPVQLGALTVGYRHAIEAVDCLALSNLLMLAQGLAPYLESYLHEVACNIESMFMQPTLARCVCGCSCAKCAADSGTECKDVRDYGWLDRVDDTAEAVMTPTEAQTVSLSQRHALFEATAAVDPFQSAQYDSSSLIPRADSASLSQLGDLATSQASESASSSASSAAWTLEARIEAVRAPYIDEKKARSAAAPQDLLLRFTSDELEAQFVDWQTAQQARTDAIFAVLVGIMILILSALEPYGSALRSTATWPLGFLFTLVPLLMLWRPAAYAAWRENLLTALNVFYVWYSSTVVIPSFITSVPAPKLCSSLTWVARMAGVEATAILPLGYMVRLQRFVPMQLLSVAIVSSHLLATCHACFPRSSLGPCVAPLALVSGLLPGVLIYTMERKARTLFLHRLNGSSATRD
jgi:hypothetical protein